MNAYKIKFINNFLKVSYEELNKKSARKFHPIGNIKKFVKFERYVKNLEM